MTTSAIPAEYQAWINSMQAAKGRWTTDPIHNGQNGRDLLVFLPSREDATKGIYTSVDPTGKAQAGTFEGAYPHMGEALYRPKWEKQFKDQSEGFSKLAERLGLSWLLAGVLGTSPYASA